MTEMGEYIIKRWDLPTMEIRINNLKKIINPLEIEILIDYYCQITQTRLDALYLTYYDLKTKYCKINRNNFGKVNTVEYISKIQYNNDNYYVIPSTNNYTWGSYTITTSTSYYL